MYLENGEHQSLMREIVRQSIDRTTGLIDRLIFSFGLVKTLTMNDFEISEDLSR